MMFNSAIRVKGKYKAIVHTGHLYDECGKVIGYKEIKNETTLGPNLFTNIGLDRFVDGTTLGQLMVCTSNNTPPASGDTVMGDALGWATTFVSSTITASNNDPMAGDLYLTVTHIRTFVPGAFGLSPVNIAKGGIIDAPGTINITTVRASPLRSAGLLVDSLGNPTTVSVNPDEYLDMTWEVTTYVDYETTGTVSLDVDGTPTDFGYAVRPSILWSQWAPMSSTNLSFSPTWTPIGYVFGSIGNRYTGALSTGVTQITTRITITGDGAISSRSTASYTPGNFYRDYTINFSPTAGNVTPDIASVLIALGSSSSDGSPPTVVYQVGYTPGIPKVNTKQLSLTFRISVSNAP